MVLYNSTGYRVLGIVCLDQLRGAHHTHISYHDKVPKELMDNIHCFYSMNYWWNWGHLFNTAYCTLFLQDPLLQVARLPEQSMSNVQCEGQQRLKNKKKCSNIKINNLIACGIAEMWKSQSCQNYKWSLRKSYDKQQSNFSKVFSNI